MPAPLAQTIDAYLRKRGSPMAGFGSVFVSAGNRTGVDPRLLVGIATIESGAGAKQKLAFNPFNWGVHRGQTYGSYTEAINDVARGLSKNYLAAGLRTPQSIVSKYAPGSDGNDEGNWASVVSGVMEELGGPSAPTMGRITAGGVPPLPPPPAAPAPPARPAFSREAFAESLRSRLMTGQPLQGRGLSDLIFSSYRTPLPATPGATPSPSAPGVAPPTTGGGFTKGGKVWVLPSSWKSTHPTSGLGWGASSAADVFPGPPGTKVGAPVGGVIVRHGSAQGGQSVYFRGDDGREYWIGHIDNMLPAGTRVERGQAFATVSADHPRPHVHIDAR